MQNNDFLLKLPLEVVEIAKLTDLKGEIPVDAFLLTNQQGNFELCRPKMVENAKETELNWMISRNLPKCHWILLDGWKPELPSLQRILLHKRLVNVPVRVGLKIDVAKLEIHEENMLLTVKDASHQDWSFVREDTIVLFQESDNYLLLPIRNAPLLDSLSQFPSISSTFLKLIQANQNYSILLSGPSGSGKSYMVKHLLQRCSQTVFWTDAGSLASNGNIQASLMKFIQTCHKASPDPVVAVLDDFNGLFDEMDAGWNMILKYHLDLLQKFATIIVIYTNSCPKKQWFQINLEMGLPSPEQRLAILSTLKPQELPSPGLLTEFTVGMSVSELVSLAKTSRDLPSLYTNAQQRRVIHNESNISWQNLNGLDEAKEIIEELVVFKTREKSKLIEMGLTIPSFTGILLHGPPGTGKTLLASCLARHLSTDSVPFHFMTCSIPSLVKGEVGESEKAVTNLFLEAKRKGRCVIFLDEIEGISRGGSGVNSRIIAQLSLQMDQLSRLNDQEVDIVLLAATNLVDSVPKSLFSPWRISSVVKIELPNVEARLGILKQISEKLNFHESLSSHLSEIAQDLNGWTGAKIWECARRSGAIAVFRWNREKTNLSITLSDWNQAKTTLK